MKLWKAYSACDGFSDMRVCAFGRCRGFDFARISSGIREPRRNCRRYAFAYWKSDSLEKSDGFRFRTCGADGIFRLFLRDSEIHGDWNFGTDDG